MSIIGGINMGNLTDYLFFFANGNVDANWQGATKGYVGDVAVDGIQADERTSGSVPYAGTMYTNDNTFSAWQDILDQNPLQSNGVVNEVARINGLEADLISAIQQINALPATPGFESVASTDLDGLNTQNGTDEVFVINITSGLNFSSKINITGDAGDVFILRWDTDADPTNGYQGQLKPQSGGAIVPLGGLEPGNFISVAGDINASGGGTTPLPPYPQGPRFNDGQGALINGGSDFSGGGFFTGYLLTTGSPDVLDPGSGLFIGGTSSLSNGIFVGGWYTLTTQFSMTSGTSGVYVSPNQATLDEPAIDIVKEVSVDGGVTFFDANTPPGPTLVFPEDPVFRYTVTNTGNTVIDEIQVTDDVYGPITIPTTTLNPGESFEVTTTESWLAGQHTNIATVIGTSAGQQVTDSDPANFFGTNAAIDVEKLVSPDNGVTFFDADTPPGPAIPIGTDPVFRYVVTNTGNVTLNNITLVDSVLGPITIPTTTLAPGESFQVDETGTWQQGQQVNEALVTGEDNGNQVSDTDLAHYFGTTAPSIDIEKLVSVDGGVTFFDADTPPGPTLVFPQDPVFKYIVTNTGNAIITDIQVNDDVYGPITIPTTTLNPAESFEVITTESWQAGQHTNVATVTGVSDGQQLTDSDPANFFGFNASIDVEKFVSPDNGVTFFDADTPPGPAIPMGTNPVFRYVVTNTGNITLNSITLNDSVLGPITIPTTTLALGESFEVIVTGTWQEGQQVNVATVTGQGDGVEVTDTDLAHYFGITEPSIDIVKFVSVDNGVTWIDANTPPGPLLPDGVSPQFRYVVTNNGGTPLENVTVTDNVLGLIGIIPLMLPGDQFEFIVA